MRHLTVKDLIEKLQRENPDAIIAATSSNFELGGATVPATGFYKFKGKVVKRNFSDSFDGGSYSTNIIAHDDHGDTEFLKF